MPFSFTVDLAHQIRLDRYLQKKFPKASLAQIYQWVRKRKVKVDGKRISDYKIALKNGNRVEVWMNEEQLEKKNLPPLVSSKQHFAVLYEDEHLMVINKEAGIAVTDASSRQMSINQELAMYTNYSGRGFCPQVVHRLDTDTAGVLIIAKTQSIWDYFYQAFKERKIEKEYLALCHGNFQKPEGRIDFPLEKKDLGQKKVVISKHGKEAITHYKVLASAKNYSLLQLRIETGRTHQIRVHLAAISHPVCLDHQYGDRELDKDFRQLSLYKKQWLFASKIAFIHPVTQKHLQVEAKLPLIAQKTLQKFRFPV